MNLSDFLAICDKQGELLKISAPVATNLELAAISRREFSRSKNSKVLLFEQPLPSRFSVVTNLFASESRMATVLRTASLADFEREIQTYLRNNPNATPQVERAVKISPTAPDTLSLLNETCRLTDLPALRCWPQENKPYFTLALAITCDPANGKHNYGLYRVQVINEDTLAINFSNSSDAYAHLATAAQQGTNLPVTLVLGCDPLLMWAAAAPLPKGGDDLAFCREFFNEDFRQLEIPNSHLLVPDSAELVISGYILPGAVGSEGPFGNHTGAYVSRLDCPLMHVSSVLHRSDAMIPFTVVGPPPSENIWLAAANEILIRQQLKQQYSDICHLVMPVNTIFHGVCIIAVHQPGVAKVEELIHSLWHSGPLQHARLIIIVDDAINPLALDSCWWRVINQLDKLTVYQNKRRTAIDASTVDVATLVAEDRVTLELIESRHMETGYYPY